MQAAAADLRSGWISFGIVPFLSPRPLAVCSSWHAEDTLCATCLRSSSRFGTGLNLVCIVHCWANWADWTTRFLSPFVCWWYADIWSLRCSPSAILDLEQRLSACIDRVHSWMQSNRLQQNTMAMAYKNLFYFLNKMTLLMITAVIWCCVSISVIWASACQAHAFSGHCR